MPLSYLNQGLGLKEDADSVARLLTRMCLTSHPDPSEENIIVSVPPTRADVIHPCDIMEDYAIAYGYNRIPRALPEMSTTGKQQPLNKLTDLLRLEMAQAGFTELLTFTMCGRKDISDRLNVPLAEVLADLVVILCWAFVYRKLSLFLNRMRTLIPQDIIKALFVGTF